MQSFNDYQQRERAYREYRERLAKASGENKRSVFDALAAAGIAFVFVDFDGEGDSGQILEPSARSADNKSCTIPTTEVTVQCASWNSPDVTKRIIALDEAIVDLCYDYLEYEHGGWENNDGAYGEFTFEVAERSVELSFNARFSDSTHYSHTF